MKRDDAYKNVKNGQGWLYLVQVINGPTKIGVTTLQDPMGRVKNVQASIPYPSRFVGAAYSASCLADERRYHDKYQAKNVRGEWFNLTEYELESLVLDGNFYAEPEYWRWSATQDHTGRLDPSLLTVARAAEYLAVTHSMVRKLIKQGRLEAATINGQYRIKRISLEQFVERHTTHLDERD